MFSILLACIEHFWGASVVRIFQGFFCGTLSAVDSTYASELATDRARGILVSLYQVSAIFGLVLSRTANIIFDTVDNGWRYEFGFCAVSPLVMFVCLFFAPESPVWLLKNKKRNDSKMDAPDLAEKRDGKDKYKSFPQSTVLYSSSSSPSPSSPSGTPSPSPSPSPPPSSSTAPLLPTSSSVNSTLSYRLHELWKQRWAVVRAILLGIFLQLAGVNAVDSFCPAILSSAGLSTRKASLWATFALAWWDFVAVLISMFTVNKVGRRPLLIFGTITATIGLIAITVGYLTQDHVANAASVSLSIAGLAVFLLGYQSGIVPPFYVIVNELFVGFIRGTGASLAMLASWLCKILVVQTFLPLADALGSGYTFLLYTCFSLLFVIFAILGIKETRENKLIE